MPNKYHKALNEAIKSINSEIDRTRKYYGNNSIVVTRLYGHIDRLKELKKLLATPQLKQSLKELDLEESK